MNFTDVSSNNISSCQENGMFPDKLKLAEVGLVSEKNQKGQK